MAIERRPSRRNPSGWQFRVRYPDPRNLGKLLSATFDNERDAKDFDALWKVKARGGALHELDAGRQLLGDYVLDWLDAWARTKSKKTRRETDRVINRYVLEADGDGWGKSSIAWMQLRQVDARVVERWLFALEDRGIGVETRRKAVYVLQQVFKRAIGHRDYPFSNPVEAVKKPQSNGRKRPQVFTPDTVEGLRRIFLDAKDELSATLVSALAYSGARPGELLACQVKHLDLPNARLQIEQRNSLGIILDGAKSKTRPRRSVPLPSQLVSDLEAWVTGKGLGVESPLFPAPTGRYWNEWAYRNWRRRTFKPAALTAGFGAASSNPYTLRHVYVSLRYRAGDNPIDVAAAAGHSPTLSQDYYAQPITEYADAGPISLEEEIAKARRKHGTG